MNQVLLSFPAPRLPPTPTDPVERTGFAIGWDHAHHGLVPPPELLHQGTPVTQGWMAGKAVFGSRTLPAQRCTRQWLALRLLAWRQGIAFDLDQLGANHLAQIQVDRCPVTRTLLGGAPGQPDAAVVVRLNEAAGYAAGNVAVLSQRAASAAAGLDVMRLVRQARAQEAGAPAVAGLDSAAWWRLAALRSFTTPLPFAQAAGLPLSLLPPNRVRLLNDAQGLQALVTSLFLGPGWSQRCRGFAALLPPHSLRHDFNLFVGALAPRVLEAGSRQQPLRLALEDAWLGERVQRRWQHLLLSLGEAAAAPLLECATAAGLGGRRLLSHTREQAVAGWALAQEGRADTVDAAHPIRWPVAAAIRPHLLPPRPDRTRGSLRPC